MVSARDEARLKEVATEITRLHGVACEVLAADLTEPGDLAVVEKRFADGPIEVLVNNAGFGQKKPFWANPIEVERPRHDAEPDRYGARRRQLRYGWLFHSQLRGSVEEPGAWLCENGNWGRP